MSRRSTTLVLAVVLAALSACGGEPVAGTSAPDTTATTGGGSPGDRDATVEAYVDALTRLADALEEAAGSGSEQSVELVLSRIDEASGFAPFFASLDPEDATEIASAFGDRVQAIALRIAETAQAFRDSEDRRIVDALQDVPSFAIATSTDTTPAP